MSCTCIQSKPVPSCVESIIIGNIGLNDTAIIIQFENIATGRVNLFQETSDSTGLVTVNLNDFTINNESNYKVKVYDENYQDTINITVNGQTDCCVYFTGRMVSGVTVTQGELSIINCE